MAIPEHLKNRIENTENNKINQILELDKNTATAEEDTANVVAPSLDSLFQKKKKKRATNIYLNEDVYQKVVTIAMESGESLTSVMEKIISASVEGVKVKPYLVKNYNDKMSKKRKPKSK